MLGDKVWKHHRSSGCTAAPAGEQSYIMHHRSLSNRLRGLENKSYEERTGHTALHLQWCHDLHRPRPLLHRPRPLPVSFEEEE